jgi:hypothetical protein
MSRSIEVIVTVDAEVTIDALGFQGKGCEATKVLEEALGKVVKRDYKPEYYKERVNQQQIGGR